MSAPWLVAMDWRDALFVHYSIDPATLGPHVPLELDLFDGRAFVSLVAFGVSLLLLAGRIRFQRSCTTERVATVGE